MKETSIKLFEASMRGEDPFINLANAIIIQAVNDYMDCRKSRDPKRTNEIMSFFKSSWYRLLTKVDYKVLLKAADDRIIFVDKECEGST